MRERRISPPLLGVACLGGVAVALLASGCAPRYGNLSGSVTYNNKPVTGGTITFFDVSEKPISGEIKPDGTYTVSKVRVGRARIAVTTPMAIEFKAQGAGDVLPNAPKPPAIPPRYGDPEKSGLTCDVTEGDQTHPVTLE
jgi:hypothetical protein